MYTNKYSLDVLNNTQEATANFCFASSHVVSRKTGPCSLPKRGLRRKRSSASSLNFHYLLISLKSCRSFLCLLPLLPIPPIFPSIRCCRTQSLRYKWPTQVAILCVTVCRMFHSSLTLRNTPTFFTRSVQLIFAILLQHHISKLPRYFWSPFWGVHVSAPYKAMSQT